ncbi:hypothetical protein GSI_08342 [Ganoderma sinense ZZ0214-1]|uniref:Uncharacterized protein n=1 Tax=Ganoderma sinense ZZ0214-1 TaxID=1077348 RepID=A0A2G8S717_9APHY|nr:hypothetical protein GSI_08342 [Ganoderma sinense ZZ0214-1]
MARCNIDHASAPFTYEPPKPEEANPPPRINALLVALSALIHSYPGNVLDVLPHLSPHIPSSICPAYAMHPLPQRKLLDSLASLIAFHPHCPAAAVALEATPSRVGLYISADPPSASFNSTTAPSLELRTDVETWLSLVREIARGRTPPSTTRPKPETDNVDDADTDVLDLPDTQLTIAVFRTCYGALRTHLRALPLRVLLRKFESRATTEWLVCLATMCLERDAHREALDRLCEHLEALLRLTDVEDAGEIKDVRHFVALHVAGRFAARALRDEGFRVFLNGIDREAVGVVEQASFLSCLVTTLVKTAKSNSTAGALALPWHIEWIAPQPTASSFDATIGPPLLQEWLHGIAWEDSPFLDHPPDATAWPYSQLISEILRDAPWGLMRRTSTTREGVEEHRYTLARAQNLASDRWRVGIGTSHCEVGLLRYLVDPAHGVHAYPYIATSYISCYACAMLVRAVGVARGPEAEFMLRSCEPRVHFPWISGLGDGVAGWGPDVVRALEEGLLADLRSLVVARAEVLVEGRDPGGFESIPGRLNDLLEWW